MATPRSSSRFADLVRVGGGSMGEVFRATDRENGQRVAVKILHRSATEDASARFRREIAVLADLRHPNVVRYVDHGTWPDGRPYLAMEWLEGEDLQQRARRQPFGMADAVEVVRRAAAALAAVHARGVVHRDLSPANIWLEPGRAMPVKLIDFGVVKPPAPDAFQTLPGAIIGTPHYMAPEQARGHEVTPRADVYGLGAVLFRLVTGRVVFPTDHVVALLGQLVLEDPPRASAVRADVPAPLDEVIAAAIARDPAQRWADAGELARALARVGSLSNVPAPKEQSSTSTLRKLVRGLDRSETAERAVPALAMGERRIVAAMVAALPDGGLPNAVDSRLRKMLREGDRLDVVHGPKLVLCLGVTQTIGDEHVRAARLALFLGQRVPGARVAIASGEATAIGPAVSGDALERAAFQLDRAQPGSPRVDSTTAPLLGTRFALREDAVGATILHEEVPASSLRRLLGREVPTVGRADELALLTGAYDEARRTGQSRAIVVRGAPGVGKTRLRIELTDRLLAHKTPPSILFCRGDALAGRAGTSCLGRALRSHLGLLDGEPEPEQREKVKAWVAERASRGLDPAEIAPFLGEVVGARFPDTASEALRIARQSPPLLTTRIGAAIVDVLRAGDEPRVLIVEDFAWVDELTLDLLGWLLNASLPLVVYAFTRPNARVPAWDGANVTTMDVAPLSAAASEQLLAAAIPGIPLDVRRRLAQRAEGNAFFLSELARHAEIGERTLPVSVQALLQARFDQLPADLRVVARAASVFGMSAWTDGVAALAGVPVDDALEALVAADLLARVETSRIAGHVEWSFRQALARDAVYATLFDADAVALHRKAGAWLEEVGEPDFAVLAMHAAAGNDAPRASVLYARATQQAYQSGQMEAVVDLAERGARLAKGPAVRTELFLAKASAAGWLGRFDVETDAASHAIAISKPSSPEWAEATALLASALRDRGRLTESDAALADALSPERTRAYRAAMHGKLLSNRARVLADLGRAGEARAAADRALELAKEATEEREAAFLRAADARAYVLAVAGDLAELIEACRTLIDIADAAGDVALGTRGRVNLGYSLNTVGLYEGARAVLTRARTDARRIRLTPLEGFALHNLGMSLARLGAIDDALDAEQRARRIGEDLGVVRLAPAAMSYEAFALALRGAGNDLTNALALARQAAALAEGQPSLVLGANAAAAFVQLRRGSFLSALELATEAQALPAGLAQDWEGLLALCHVEALRALGDDDATPTLIRARDRIAARAALLRSPEAREAFRSRVFEHQALLALAAHLAG